MAGVAAAEDGKGLACTVVGRGSAGWLSAAENHDKDGCDWKSAVVAAVEASPVDVPGPSWFANQAMGAGVAGCGSSYRKEPTVLLVAVKWNALGPLGQTRSAGGK